MIHSAKDLFKIEKEYNHLSWKQKVLAKQVEIPKKREGYFPNTGDIVLAMDIQYQKDKAYVAGDLHYWKKEHIGTFVGVAQAEMPYVPTYFCFREGPPLLLLIEELQKRSFFPDMIVVDGHV